MDTLDVIRTLRAVRRYADRPVPHDVVRRVVDAARLTGSSQNGQPWHFVVVTDRAVLRRLGAALGTGPYTAGAAFAVVVAVERSSRFGVSDGSRAIQSMMLAAWAEGVGSNWVGFGGLQEVASLLGIPGSFDVLAVVPFGHPSERGPRRRKDRRPLADVASLERFGEPFA